jgi:glycine hydroxymethyltransferase
MIVCGASAYSRTIDFRAFAEVARSVGAFLLADIAHIAGLVAAGVHPSPVPHAEFVTTTTHKTLRGPRGGMILCKAEHAKALDKAVFPGQQGGPLEHMIAAKAVCFREALSDSFRAYQTQIVTNAKVLADEMSRRGYRLVSGGTDNHLFLVDLGQSGRGITGSLAESTLERIGVTVNKNMIPYDPRKPMDPSGIRLGTPLVTSRGMGTDEMRVIARLVDEALLAPHDDAKLAALREETRGLTRRFPIRGRYV